jgi:mRNA interferase MazF
VSDHQQSFGDAQAIVIAQTDFKSGMLRLQSYARPSKLFTANEGLIISIEGTLKPEKLKEIREEIIRILKQSDE